MYIFSKPYFTLGTLLSKIAGQPRRQSGQARNTVGEET
jgi:hypothetical protein